MNKTKFLTAYIVSSMGDWLYKLALPIIIYQKTNSAIIMSVVYGLTFLPYVVITPFGGVIADRFKRQNILIYGDLSSTIITILLTTTVLLIPNNISLICVLVFLLASVTSLCHPAFQGFIPYIAKPKEFSKINSLVANTDNFLILLGPLCSGVIIATIGGTFALCLNAGSFLVSALLIRLTETLHPEEIKNSVMSLSSVLSDLCDGYRHAMSVPLIKYGCLMFIFSNFGINIFYANFMYYMMNYLHLTATYIGYTLSMSSLGAIIGAVIAPKLIKHFDSGRIILFCCFVESITILLLLFASNYIWVGVFWGMNTLLSSIVVVTYFTLRQTLVSSEFLGRTVAITRAISYSAIPVASVVGGMILRYTNNMQYVILVGGIVLLINGIIGLFSPMAKVKIATNK